MIPFSEEISINGNLRTISFDTYLSNFKQLELKLLINGKNVTSNICI